MDYLPMKTYSIVPKPLVKPMVVNTNEDHALLARAFSLNTINFLSMSSGLTGIQHYLSLNKVRQTSPPALRAFSWLCGGVMSPNQII